MSSNSEIISDKAVLVFFFLWRQLLGEFRAPSRKKTAFFNYCKVTQNFGAALVWGVSFIYGVDKLDFSP